MPPHARNAVTSTPGAIPVPWEQAETIREALRRHGCLTTLCLNPETRQARLELWPGVSADEALALIEQLSGGHPPATRPASPAASSREVATKPAEPVVEDICI